jgi:hypothetical protein
MKIYAKDLERATQCLGAYLGKHLTHTDIKLDEFGLCRVVFMSDGESVAKCNVQTGSIPLAIQNRRDVIKNNYGTIIDADKDSDDEDEA